MMLVMVKVLILTGVQTFHHGDGVDQIPRAEGADNVGVQVGQLHCLLLLLLLHHLLGRLGLGQLGGLLDWLRHLHPVLVLEGRGAGGSGLLVHCRITLK